MRNISLTSEDCPERCEGLIIGVRREPVGREFTEGFDRLLKEYENYKCQNYSDLYFSTTIKGILTNEIITIHKIQTLPRSQI